MSNPTPANKCCFRVSNGTWSLHDHACGKTAKYTEDIETYQKDEKGKAIYLLGQAIKITVPMHFCGTHSPAQKKIREDAKRAQRDAEYNSRKTATTSLQAKADEVVKALGLSLSDAGFNWEISPLTDQGRPTGSYRVSHKVLTAILAMAAELSETKECLS